MQPPEQEGGTRADSGRLAALTNFAQIARSALPFFKLLKKDTTEIGPECDAAFSKIKQCLATHLILSKPHWRNPPPLLIGWERSKELGPGSRRKEWPRTNILRQKALQSSELRYRKPEKLAFAIIMAGTQIAPYFQAHKITVRTTNPFDSTPCRTGGRMIGWAIELSEFDITYEARHAIKSQALAISSEN
ncbi:hypothetical protein K1719_040518 [Acacia pycnantha]|nr:hypothetical protein K1719_040518 [Acacia pycnantha]